MVCTWSMGIVMDYKELLEKYTLLVGRGRSLKRRNQALENPT
jgi:hypothetical protein